VWSDNGISRHRQDIVVVSERRERLGINDRRHRVDRVVVRENRAATGNQCIASGNASARTHANDYTLAASGIGVDGEAERRIEP
jgi:hypothetical protein